MKTFPRFPSFTLFMLGGVCSLLLAVGCSDPVMQSNVGDLGSGKRDGGTEEPRKLSPRPAVNQDVGQSSAVVNGSESEDPTRIRTFAIEGPDGALRIGFDDLDLQKIINMENVTRDCVEKMPEWMRELSGKRVRLRGFMKPTMLETGLPAFPLVRSTDMCCFGPKGKVYHMAAVNLKKGTTTDYIDLKPFDVVGTFRIEKCELEEDGLVFLLYHVDDAQIVQR